MDHNDAKIIAKELGMDEGSAGVKSLNLSPTKISVAVAAVFGSVMGNSGNLNAAQNFNSHLDGMYLSSQVQNGTATAPRQVAKKQVLTMSYQSLNIISNANGRLVGPIKPLADIASEYNNVDSWNDTYAHAVLGLPIENQSMISSRNSADSMANYQVKAPKPSSRFTSLYFYTKGANAYMVNPSAIKYTAQSSTNADAYLKSDVSTPIAANLGGDIIKKAVAVSTGHAFTEQNFIYIVTDEGDGTFKYYKWNISLIGSQAPELVDGTIRGWKKTKSGAIAVFTNNGRVRVGDQAVGGLRLTPASGTSFTNAEIDAFLTTFDIREIPTYNNTTVTGVRFDYIYKELKGGSSGDVVTSGGTYDQDAVERTFPYSVVRTATTVLGITTSRLVIGGDTTITLSSPAIEQNIANYTYLGNGYGSHQVPKGGLQPDQEDPQFGLDLTQDGFLFYNKSTRQLAHVMRNGTVNTPAAVATGTEAKQRTMPSATTFYLFNGPEKITNSGTASQPIDRASGMRYQNTTQSITQVGYSDIANDDGPISTNQNLSVDYVKRITGRSPLGFKYNLDTKDPYHYRVSSHKALLEQDANLSDRLILVDAAFMGYDFRQNSLRSDNYNQNALVAGSGTDPYMINSRYNNPVYFKSGIMYFDNATVQRNGGLTTEIRGVAAGASINVLDKNLDVSLNADNVTLNFTGNAAVSESMVDPYSGRVLGLSASGDLYLGGILYSGQATKGEMSAIERLEQVPVEEYAKPILSTLGGEFTNKVRLTWVATPGATHYKVFRNGVQLGGLINSTSFEDLASGTGPNAKATYEVRAVFIGHTTPAAGLEVAVSASVLGWINNAPTDVNGMAVGNEGTTITGTLSPVDLDLAKDAYEYSILTQPPVGVASIVDDVLSHQIPSGNYGVAATRVEVTDLDGKKASDWIASVMKKVSPTALVASDGNSATKVDLSWPAVTLDESAKTGGLLRYRVMRKYGANPYAQIAVVTGTTYSDTEAVALNFGFGNKATYKVEAFYVPPGAAIGANDQLIYTSLEDQGYINRAPDITLSLIETNQGTAKVFTPTITDVDSGDVLTVTAPTAPGHGTATVGAGNAVTYTPAAPFIGVDRMRLKVTDAFGASDEEFAYVTVKTATKQPLTASQGDFSNKIDLSWNAPTIVAGAPTSVKYRVYAKGADEAGFTMIATDISATSFSDTRGLLTAWNSSKKGTYRVEAYVESPMVKTLLWTSNDTTAYVNNVPTDVSGVFTTTMNTAVNFTPVVNDLDAGETFTYAVTTQGAHGSGSIVGGQVRYTPAAGFSGVDHLEIEATDGAGKKVKGHVTIVTSTATPQSITATQGTFSNRINTAWDAAVSNFSASDGGSIFYRLYAKEPSDANFFVIATQPGITHSDTRGAVTDNSIGRKMKYKVEKVAKILGVDYVISSSSEVEGFVNNGPTALNGYATAQNTTQVNVAMTVSDVDFGDTFTYSIVSAPSNGVATVVGNVVKYQANSGFWGADSFEVKAVDASGLEITGRVYVLVSTTVLQSMTTSQGDYPNRVDLTWNPNNAIQTGGIGSVFYRVLAKGAEDADYIVLDSGRTTANYSDLRGKLAGKTYQNPMLYKIEWSMQIGANAPYAIATTAPTQGWINNAPSSVSGGAQTNKNTAVDITPVISDLDLPADAHTVSIKTAPEFGSATVNGNKITYTPNAGFFGVDGVEVTVTDYEGGKVDGYLWVAVKETAARAELLTTTTAQFKDRVDLTWSDFQKHSKAVVTQRNLIEEIKPLNQKVQLSGSHTGTTYSDIRAELNTAPRGVNNKVNYRVTQFVTVPGVAGEVQVAALGNKEGWVNSPPVVSVTNLSMFQRDPERQVNYTYSDPDSGDALDINLELAPTLGTVRIDDSVDKVFYTPSGRVGTDQFTLSFNDNGGNKVNRVVSVEVKCAAPFFESSSVKDGIQAYLFSDKAVSTRTSIETCHGAVTVEMDVFDSTNQRVASTSISRPGITAFDKLEEFYIRDLAPGNYKAVLDMTGPNLTFATQKIELPFTVKPVVMPQITQNQDTLTEDDFFEVRASQGGESCDVTGDQAIAIGQNKCLVEWIQVPAGVSGGVRVAANGYAIRGADQISQANVFVFDSSQTKRLAGQIQKLVTVLPGAPISLQGPTFTGDQRQIKDFQDIRLTQKSGPACEIFTTAQAAENRLFENNTVRACVFEWIQLPRGIYDAKNGKPEAKGRIIDAASKRVDWKISKYYKGGRTVAMDVDGLDIPVFPGLPKTALNPTEVQEKYAVNAQKVLATVIDSGTPTDPHPCRLTSNLNKARNSYLNQAEETVECLVEFTSIPAGLGQVQGTDLAKIEGVPTEVGTFETKWNTFVVLPDGTKELVGTGKTPIVVANPTPPRFTFAFDTDLSSANVNGTPIKVMPRDQQWGTITITEAGFGQVQSIVKEKGAAVGDTVQNLATGSTSIAESTGLKPAWSVREFEITAEYEQFLAGTSGATPINVKLIQPPPTMQVMFDKPITQIADNRNFDTSVSIVSSFSGMYNKTEHGEWVAFLAERNADGSFNRISGDFPVDDKGVAKITNQPPEAYNNKNIAAVIKPKLYPETQIQYASKAGKVVMVKGSGIPATLQVGSATGVTPLRLNMFVDALNRRESTLISEYQFEISLDGGQKWLNIGRSQRSSLPYAILEGGSYLIRAKTYNLYTNEVFTTNSVDIKATDVYRASLSARNLVLPKEPVIISSRITNFRGFDAEPEKVDVEWMIDSGNGSVNVIRDVPSITLNSEVPATTNVTMRVKSKLEDGAISTNWTTVTKSIQFGNPPPPRASMTGPRLGEVGADLIYKAVIRPGWTTRDVETNLAVKWEWVMPSGEVVPDLEEIKFVPADFDMEVGIQPGVPKTMRKHEIKLRAWVDGMKESTTVEAVYPVMVQKYVFPLFGISTRTVDLVAPAYVALQLVPTDREQQGYMRGKVLKYNWTQPEGLNGRLGGNTYSAVIDLPGTYSFSGTVEDDRGNKQEVSYTVVVGEPRPYSMTLELLPGLKYNRAPMTWIVRNQVFGGHPRDRVTSYEMKINNELIGASSNGRPPRFFVLPDPGTYNVEITGFSTMGKVVGASKEITVNPNQIPVCEPLTATVTSANNGHIVYGRCNDVDGRVNKIRWYFDDIEIRSTSTRIFLDWDNDPRIMDSSSVVVKFEVEDDSGAAVMTELEIARPAGATPLGTGGTQTP